MIKPLLGQHRIYVLDTNVLIHDPSCIYNFEEHDVVIPIPVLEELDRLKSERSDRGRQARAATRNLDTLIDEYFIAGEMGNSVTLPAVAGKSPGKLLFMPAIALDQPALDFSIVDNQILSVAIDLSSSTAQEGEAQRVVMVTNDTNMRVKCAAFGMHAESYRNDSVLDDSELMPCGYVEYPPEADIFDQFDTVESEPVQLSNGLRSVRYYVSGATVAEWHPGLFLFQEGGTHEYVVLSIDGQMATLEQLIPYYNGRNVFGVNAKDPLQNYALNALMNEHFDLVTLTGSAGTGKTYLVMAAALEHVLEKKGCFEKIIITRETVEMGERIGFLPGNEAEKMNPWLAGFFDNIEQLVGMEDQHKASGMDIITNRIQVCSIGFLRGRSLTNTLLIIDEVQNITPKAIRGIVTRAGEGTKVVCMGNLAQIDTPYLNAGSTGLAHLVQNFKEYQYSGHVTLNAIRRSRLAEFAENVL